MTRYPPGAALVIVDELDDLSPGWAEIVDVPDDGTVTIWDWLCDDVFGVAVRDCTPLTRLAKELLRCR